jgi:hypothetical protein
MCGAVVGVIIVIMMVQDVIGMLGYMLDDEFRSVAATTAQYMREVSFRSSNRLPRKHQHHQYQKDFFHIPAIIAACNWTTRYTQTGEHQETANNMQ